VQETLLLPLWRKAFETRKKNPWLVDEKAVKIIKNIDYNFSGIEKIQAFSQHGWVARSLQPATWLSSLSSNIRRLPFSALDVVRIPHFSKKIKALGTS